MRTVRLRIASAPGKQWQGPSGVDPSNADAPASESLAAECRSCINERLLTRPGVYDVRLDHDDDGLFVEVDYDPAQVPLTHLQQELRCGVSCADVDLPANTTCMCLPVENMSGRGCERTIESVLSRMPGVTASACYAASAVRIEFDRQRWAMGELVRAIEHAGYRPRPDRAHHCGEAAGADATDQQAPIWPRIDVAAEHRRGAEIGEEPAPARPAWISLPGRAWSWLRQHPELMLVLIGGLLLAGGWLTWMLEGPLWLRLGLLLLAAVASSTQTFPDAIRAVRHLRLDVDVLMFAAATGAWILGHYEEGVFLLFLFGLGTAGEHMALQRARDAVGALSNIAPETAHWLRDDGTVDTVNVDELAPGQRVLVRPFERVPVDGNVLEGASAIDQSAITGESYPVEKVAGDDVFAGTINGQGRLVVSVTQRASETTLARIIRMVEEAQTMRSPTQVFTERIERWYVPMVFAITAVLIVVPPVLGIEPRMVGGALWGGWFYQAMAFLTAASPCALAIGTPAAVLCGVARAARVGVLIKGGAFLEAMGQVRAVAFDKTGTLTIGRPEVSHIIAAEGLDEDHVLALAGAVESQVTHPLADAIAEELNHRGLPTPRAEQVEQVEQVAGEGAEGTVDGYRILVGRAPTDEGDNSWPAGLRRALPELRRAGSTVVAVLCDGRPIGLLGLTDRLRDESAGVVGRLKRLGIRHTVMLSGDHAAAARAVGNKLGLDAAEGDLMPEQKLTLIDRLRKEHGSVAMVGDGVNDAPALAAAEVGIAVGGARAHVAMETADVVLMGSSLSRLPEAVGLSRFSRRVIGQNLLIALGTIAVVAPLAALGYASLAIAVLLHEGSTVVVVLNALRLLRYRDRSGIGTGDEEELEDTTTQRPSGHWAAQGVQDG